MVLSAVLKNYSDLIVVGALLVINAILGFMQDIEPPGSWRRCENGCRSTPASVVIQAGRSFPPESWFPATSFACDPATLFRRT